MTSLLLALLIAAGPAQGPIACGPDDSQCWRRMVLTLDHELDYLKSSNALLEQQHNTDQKKIESAPKSPLPWLGAGLLGGLILGIVLTR